MWQFVLLLRAANTAVAISTYAMVAYTQKRAWDSQQVYIHYIHTYILTRVFDPSTTSCSIFSIDDELPAAARMGPHDLGRYVQNIYNEQRCTLYIMSNEI